MSKYGMLKKVNLVTTLTAAAIAALLFCIAVFAYIRQADYNQTWLLYLGSFAFMVVIWVHTMRDSKKRANNDESTVALVFASHVATILGVVISVLVSFILLSVFVPGYLEAGNTAKALEQVPANMVHDKTEGLSFIVIMAASVINFAAGSFGGIILPFYLKRNQTRDSKTPTPLHQRGMK